MKKIDPKYRFACKICGLKKEKANSECCGRTSYLDMQKFISWGACGGINFANQIISSAISKGVLAKAKEFKCVDCGAPAFDYDHRDYNTPLKVQPVCRSCNILRGPSKPRDGFIDGMLYSGFPLYRVKRKARELLTVLGMDTGVLDSMPESGLRLRHWLEIFGIDETEIPKSRRHNR